jgi:predicted O-methyltransferase YrrM
MLSTLGVDPADSMRGYENWRSVLELAMEKVRHASGQQGAVSAEDGMLLFGLARALQPEVVIETGIAAGISSSFLGAALAENGHGTLYSIELPTTRNVPHSCADGVEYGWSVWGPGWAIPPKIRQALGERHVFLFGDVRDELPRLLGEIGQVDMFFHDDLHLPDHVSWEFQSVWPRIRPGGVLAADDVDFGWIKFVRQNKLPEASLVNLDRLAAVRKPKAAVSPSLNSGSSGVS